MLSPHMQRGINGGQLLRVYTCFATVIGGMNSDIGFSPGLQMWRLLAVSLVIWRDFCRGEEGADGV